MHVPVWHVSICVHALTSLHIVPSALAGLEHMPVVVLDVPSLWHESGAVQTTGIAPVQVPAWQESVCVQALLSLQGVLFGAAGLEHMPVIVLHVPTSWHESEAAQTTGIAPVHAPAWHVSICVQALLSLHIEPSALAGLEHMPVVVMHVPTS